MTPTSPMRTGFLKNALLWLQWIKCASFQFVTKEWEEEQQAITLHNWKHTFDGFSTSLPLVGIVPESNVFHYRRLDFTRCITFHTKCDEGFPISPIQDPQWSGCKIKNYHSAPSLALVDTLSEHKRRVDCSDLNTLYSFIFTVILSAVSELVIATTIASPYPKRSGDLAIVSMATIVLAIYYSIKWPLYIF